MDGAEAGTDVTRSILLYVRSHARPGDRARRGKIPAPPKTVHFRAHRAPPLPKALREKGSFKWGAEAVGDKCTPKRAKEGEQQEQTAKRNLFYACLCTLEDVRASLPPFSPPCGDHRPKGEPESVTLSVVAVIQGGTIWPGPRSKKRCQGCPRYDIVKELQGIRSDRHGIESDPPGLTGRLMCREGCRIGFGRGSIQFHSAGTGGSSD
jgi:hypothetical protein